jgi:DnaJ-class molecular chaperone
MTASDTDIKRAYRTLAKRLHPDVCKEVRACSRPVCLRSPPVPRLVRPLHAPLPAAGRCLGAPRADRPPGVVVAQEGAEHRFRQVNEAYELLADRRTRTQHDAELRQQVRRRVSGLPRLSR